MLGLFFAPDRRADARGAARASARARSSAAATHPIKIAFNMASMLAQVAGRRFVFVAVIDVARARRPTPMSPASWVAALAATLAADLRGRHSPSSSSSACGRRPWTLGELGPHARPWRDRHRRRHRPGAGHRRSCCGDEPDGAGPARRRSPCSASLLYRGYHVQRLRYSRLELLYQFTRSVDQALQNESVHGDRAGRGVRAAARPQRLGRALPSRDAVDLVGRRVPGQARCCSRAAARAPTHDLLRADGPRRRRWPLRCATAARSPACSWSSDRLDDMSTFDARRPQALRGAGRPRQRRAHQLGAGRPGPRRRRRRPSTCRCTTR